MLRFLFLIFLIFLSIPSIARIVLGTGFNSATAGRIVPSITLGVGKDSFEFLFSSTGVATKAYYHSAYRFSGYWIWSTKDTFFNQIDTGFGPGALYASRGYKELDGTSESKSDFVFGPSFFVRWMVTENIFVTVDALYGLIGPSDRFGDILGLNARDNVTFIAGVRF